MWKNLIETDTTRNLEMAMDVSARRRDLILQNVANVNTPGYKRVDIDFETMLKQTVKEAGIPLARTNTAHFPGLPMTVSAPPLIRDSSTTMRLDGNNVDIESEMAKMAENSFYYQSLTNSWRSSMDRLKAVIEG